MPEDKYTYATEFSDASASLDKMRDSLRDVSSSTSDWVKNFSTLQDSLNAMTSAMSNLTEKPLVSKEDVANADKLLSAMTRIKKMKEDGKRADEKQVGLFKAMDVLSKSISRNFKITETDLKNISKQWTNIRSTTSQVARSHIGIDLSLTGIVMALVDTYNLMRRIHGESMMIAGRMGGTTKAIGASKAAIGDLHKNFAMSYDDAAKIVHVLGKVGISADRLAKGAGRQASAYKTSREYLDAQDKILEDQIEAQKKLAATANIGAPLKTMKTVEEIVALEAKYQQIQKRVSEEQEKHFKQQEELAKQDAKRAAIASEIYAIQVKYGIGIEQSANQLKNLMANYGKTDDQARALYGTVLGTFDTLESSGKLPFDIGVDEMVSDWNKLIDYARVYKMDMLGILAVYQSMLRDSKLIGLEGVSTQVKKEITKTLVSAPLEMSYGWKARLGEGTGTPAQRALAFEKRATEEPMYVLKRTIETMEEMLGGVTEGNKADQEIRGRMLLEKMGYGKESSIELTRAWLSKGLTGKNVDKLLKSQADDLKKMKDNEEKWNKHRGDLIDYAKDAAIAVTSTQDLVKRYVIDLLIPAVIAIRDGIRHLVDMPFFGGTGKYAARQEAKESVAMLLEKGGVGGNVDLMTEKLMKSKVLQLGVFGSEKYKSMVSSAYAKATQAGGVERGLRGVEAGKAEFERVKNREILGGVERLRAEALEQSIRNLSPQDERLFATLLQKGDDRSMKKALSILEGYMTSYLRLDTTKPGTKNVGGGVVVGPTVSTRLMR